MPSLNLNRVSSVIRNYILALKINQDYKTGERPILYNYNTPINVQPPNFLDEYKPGVLEYNETHREDTVRSKIDQDYWTLEEPVEYPLEFDAFNEPLEKYKYPKNALERTNSLDYGRFDYLSELDKAPHFVFDDSYRGNVRRDEYNLMWDKRLEDSSEFPRNPNIYKQIQSPDDTLTRLQQERHPYGSYIRYINEILGRNIPETASGTAESSNPENLIAAIIRGDGVGLSLSSAGQVGVITDLDIRQTLAGRIVSQITGNETPMARFGLKAAAISMANQMMAKTGQFVSGAVRETARWTVSNTVGRLFGGDGSDFDINAFGSSRITNPPGIMDDILNATGLNRGLNAAAGGLGLGFLLENNNWSQTATVGNDGRYVQIDPDLLVNTTNNSQPDFNAFIDPQGRRGRAFAEGEEPGWFKRTFRNKTIEREVVSEWEFRRLQQDTLIDWTGAMNARMIFSLLDLNKYSPGYTKRNSRRERRRGNELEDKGYNAIRQFRKNQYINPNWKGLPVVAESIDPRDNDDPMVGFSVTDINETLTVLKRHTITWGEAEVRDEEEVVEADERSWLQRLRDNRDDRKQERQDRRESRKANRAERKERRQNTTLRERWKENREARNNREQEEIIDYGDFLDLDVNGKSVRLIKNLNETDTLMGKTSALFAANKIGTMISRFHKPDEKASFIQTGVHPVFGMSKGRALANPNYIKTITPGGYEDPWCRVWTAESQYRNILNAIRPFLIDDEDNPDPGNKGVAIPLKKLHEKVDFIRPYLDNFTKYTSLQDSGTPKIAPYTDDFKDWKPDKNNRHAYNRRYMFSIENLAWKGLPLENILCPSQIGPNGGRIYWFSPLNLSFTDDVTSSWTNTPVIGRGEPLFSFTGNTRRRGNLSFSMVVDHSTFHEYMKARTDGSPEDAFHQLVLRFDAGCEIPEIIERKNKDCTLTVKESSEEISTVVDIVPPDISIIVEPQTIDLVTVFFPNDFSGVNWHEHDEKTIDIKKLVGIKNRGGGKRTMDYLYYGGGSSQDGKNPHRSGSMFGYEMENRNGQLRTHNITLSNVHIPKNVSGSITMYSYTESGYTNTVNKVEGLSPTTRNRPNTYNNDTAFINHFNHNMHVTDQIVPYYESRPPNSNKSFRREVLPRHGYQSFMSNWDIGNFKLNSNILPNSKDIFSFGAFYEICTGNYDGSHKKEIEGKKYNTKEELQKIFNEADRIEILGNASKDGTAVDNKRLGRYRAVSLALFIIETLELNIVSPQEGGPTWVIKDEVLAEPATNTVGVSSSEDSKKFRHAHVRIVTKQSGGEELHPRQEQTTIKKDVEMITTEYNLKRVYRYDEEMDFYKYIGDRGETDLAWTKIRDRYNKYIPALWSCTPEGFNARLTFLHQCTRSGPTNVAGQNSGGVSNIANLAFGRPPVCILRIGDFIQSKILIESIKFNYDEDGIRWDLNPEGIGIQPMKVKVDIGFDYIGGQDITGAIARLQNAVSFNYYANTSVYDDRSDGNKEDLTGIDMGRKRGIHAESGTSRTISTSTITVSDGSQYSKLPENTTAAASAKKIAETNADYLSSSGLFNPFSYKNGNVYLGVQECPYPEGITKDPKIKKNPTETNEHKIEPGHPRIFPSNIPDGYKKDIPWDGIDINNPTNNNDVNKPPQSLA